MSGTRDGQNEYERAFEGRLAEQCVRFARVDQSRRCRFGRDTLKTFDYLIYSRQGGCVLVELKGRIFRGASLAGRTGLQTWVFADDVAALARWQRQFEIEFPQACGIFVFAYRIDQIAADCDGLEVYEVDGRRYVFLAIERRAYQSCMRPRSPRWKTVSCPAGDFRSLCFPVERLWLGD